MSVRTFPHTDQKQRAYRVHTMLHDTEPLYEVVSNPIAKRQSIRTTAICSKHDSLPIAAHPTSLSPHVRNMTAVCEAYHPCWHQGLRMREPSPTAKSWHLHAASFILASRPPHAGVIFHRGNSRICQVLCMSAHDSTLPRASPNHAPSLHLSRPSQLARKPSLIREHDASPSTQTCSPQAHYLLTRQPPRS